MQAAGSQEQQLSVCQQPLSLGSPGHHSPGSGTLQSSKCPSGPGTDHGRPSTSLHVLGEAHSSSAGLRWRSSKSTTSAARWLTAPLSARSRVLFSSLPFHLAPRLLGIRGTFALRGEHWPDSHSIWPGSLGKAHLSCSPESQDVFGWSGNSSIHRAFPAAPGSSGASRRVHAPSRPFLLRCGSLGGVHALRSASRPLSPAQCPVPAGPRRLAARCPAVLPRARGL